MEQIVSTFFYQPFTERSETDGLPSSCADLDEYDSGNEQRVDEVITNGASLPTKLYEGSLDRVFSLPDESKKKKDSSPTRVCRKPESYKWNKAESSTMTNTKDLPIETGG
ncbi:Hypothetical predicted protein [Paramuricea clavata]|uniref:Uncharacterized protein n=1 Tax=Paramuricea clavata TaxID=317549 RepID=A0A7D9E5T9_PARCT|nr:Hypothetical predicted protein [Paramuricea clavata]